MRVIPFGNETRTILDKLSSEDLYTDTDYALNSIISAMSPALNYNEEEILPKSYDKQRILGNEINKAFIKNIDQLAQNNDFLIIDLLDERYNLLLAGDSILLDSWIIKESNIYKDLEFNKLERRSIPFETWKEYCDKFIEEVSDKFNDNVIIHEMYLSERYFDNGQFHYYGNIANLKEINRKLKELYNYLEDNLPDAKVIKIEENNYTDKSLLNVLNPAKKNNLYNDEFLRQLLKFKKKQRYKYKVAVIIASHNVEEYIEESINSVLNQTLPEVQAIVIDDGSTDNTPILIEEIAKKNSRVSFRLIENTGSPSTPRNIGKGISDAEFIMFLDGDDYLDPKACEILYSNAIEKNSDLVLGKMMSFIGERFFETLKFSPRFRPRVEFLDKIEGYKEVHITKDPVMYLFPSCCAKLFKRELIEKIDFHKGIKYSEDLLFSVGTFFNSKKTIVIEDFVYFYRGRNESANKSITQIKTIQNFMDLQISLEIVDNIIKKHQFSIKNLKSFNNSIELYRLLEASSHLGSINQYEPKYQVRALKIIKNTLFKKDFDRNKIFIFTIQNYLFLSLLLDGKFKDLVTLSQLMNAVKMYDYNDKYPFKIVMKNENYYFTFKSNKEVVFVNINHYMKHSKLINKLTDIKFEGNKLILKGVAYFNNISISNKQDINHKIIMKKRKTKEEKVIVPKYVYNNKFSTSLYKYGHGGYEVVIPFDESVKTGGYDLFISTEYLGVSKTEPLGGMINNFIYKAKSYFFKNSLNLYEVVPIVKNKNRLAINFKRFDNKYSYLKRQIIANVRRKQFTIMQIKRNSVFSRSKKLKLITGVVIEDITKKILSKKEIWLIGEKVGNSANDTGYWFYKYVRENAPKKDVYYIIDKNSPDYKKVKKLGNIINYFSLKHIVYSMNARYIFSSDNVNVLLPSNIKHLRNAERVFIQHGVILPGRVDNVYHASRDITDYIITSSDFERSIVKNHLGFNDEEILNVGLPRFDTLKDRQKEKRVMMSFTWRKDIQNVEQLLDSLYFKTIKSLVNNEKFINTLDSNNIKLDICLHPRISELLEKSNPEVLESLRTSKQVNLYNFNKTDIRELIETSTMLITDYSSILFDFLYLEKPIVNYLFQNNTPISEEGIEKVLPGKVVYDEDEVIDAVIAVMVRKSKIKKVNKRKYIKYSDGNNCRRLMEIIN